MSSSKFSGSLQSLRNNTFSSTSKNPLEYLPVNFPTAIFNAVLAIMTFAANALVLAAIWKNPSLRTPSYVLLAALIVTDFCNGLVTQPAYLLSKMGELTRNKNMMLIASQVAVCIGFYSSFLRGFLIVLSSVERWLYMSRRSLLTVRRAFLLCTMFALFLLILVAGTFYVWYFWKNFWNEFFTAFKWFFSSLTAIGVAVTAFAYFKVFQIIRNHQRQIQTNQHNISIEKYKKSVFTLLYIFAIFVISYAPMLCCSVIFDILQDYGETYKVTLNISVALLFSSSIFYPLLYYRRIKEIRHSTRSIVRNVFWKQNGEES